MGVLVQKFGGSSLDGPEAIGRCADLVAAARRRGQAVVVVVSAMGGTTDDLLTLAGRVNEEPDPRDLDVLLATAEQASSALMSLALRARGVEALALRGADAGIRTTGPHGEARIASIDTSRLRRELAAERVPVVAGFQGAGPEGEITTLGRGGTDITAAAIAASLGDDGEGARCDIYTDVDGVYTTDPSLVPEARLLERIGYEAMLALASGGAQVLHPRAVEIARERGVPVRVLDSRHGGGRGTLIDFETALEGPALLGCSLVRGLTRIEVRGAAPLPIAQAVGGLAHRLELAPAARATALLVRRADTAAILARLDEAAPEADLLVEDGWAQLTVVGRDLLAGGLAARMLATLEEHAIGTRDVVATEGRVVCALDDEVAEQGLRVVHERLVETRRDCARGVTVA